MVSNCVVAKTFSRALSSFSLAKTAANSTELKIYTGEILKVASLNELIYIRCNCSLLEKNMS